MIDHSLDLLQDYMAQLDRLNAKLDITSAEIEGAFGTEKANLLRQQIGLLEQQQAMLKKEQADVRILADSYKSLLQGQGFRVDGNGAVTNATSKILEYEHALESAQKAQDAYSGDNEGRKKSLQNAVTNAQDKLNKAKETLDQYYEMSNKVGETEAEWKDIAKTIAEVRNEIYLANKEAQNFYYEARTSELEYQYDKLSDQLDILQSKMELKRDPYSVNLLNEELNLLRQQQAENKKIEESYRNQMIYYEGYLREKGFQFNIEGDIVNGADALNANKLSEEIETIQEAYEKYMELQRDTLPDLQKEWLELEKLTEETNEELKELEKVKIFDDLDGRTKEIEKLESQIEDLQTKLELSDGDISKVYYMEKQMELLDKQISQQLMVTGELKKQQEYLKNSLSEYNFTFDAEGNITNLNNVLGSAQTIDEYEMLKEKAEEYQDTQTQITESKNQWKEYQLNIKETQQEIENLKYEMKQLKDEANLKEFENSLDVVNNKLEKLQSIGDLGGINSLDNLNEQLAVIKEQQKATEDLLEYQLNQAVAMQNELKTYGFSINSDGTIDNTANQLEYLKGILSDDEFDKVDETLQNYFDVALSEIPDLETQLIDYQRDYQDILEQKLEATEKVEKEITKIIEKQVEVTYSLLC